VGLTKPPSISWRNFALSAFACDIAVRPILVYNIFFGFKRYIPAEKGVKEQDKWVAKCGMAEVIGSHPNSFKKSGKAPYNSG
jgi:hypothetical protein